jgi:hypothetical protein
MGDNSDSHKLLSVVATVHHERVGETLNDGAVGLAESLLGISTGRVGDVDWGADLNVVAVSNISPKSLCPSNAPRSILLRIYSPGSRNGSSYVNEISRISTSS